MNAVELSNIDDNRQLPPSMFSSQGFYNHQHYHQHYQHAEKNVTQSIKIQQQLLGCLGLLLRTHHHLQHKKKTVFVKVSFYGPLTVMAFTYVRIYQAATAYR